MKIRVIRERLFEPYMMVTVIDEDGEPLCVDTYKLVGSNKWQLIDWTMEKVLEDYLGEQTQKTLQELANNLFATIDIETA